MAGAQAAPRQKLSAIDLFSGCGGLTAGLKQAGYRVLAAVELDEKAADTYELNHPGVFLVRSDIREVKPKDLMKSLGLCPGELDLLAGCPPCQGFSRIRKRNKGPSIRDERNSLIDEFARFALELKPKLIMMENVPGLSEYYKFDQFIRALEAAGYSTRYEVLNVADFGVPQRRKRLIISASRVGPPEIANSSTRRRTVRDAIGNMPPPGNTGDELHDFPENRSSRIQLLICSVPKNGGSRTDLPSWMTLKCHKKSTGFRDVYGRMKWDDVSPTITSGCINPSKGRFLHPSCNRTITLREAALLQGFPKRYRFMAMHGKESVALMIGNALPPPFIAAQAKAMARSLRKSVSTKE